MIEPKIGEILSLHGIKVKTYPLKDNEHCKDCAFAYLDCENVVCIPVDREDATQVIFKKVKEMEIKSIVVPDGWDCIVKNGIVTFQEKKENTQNPPRSWEEFCEKYPLTDKEAFIDSYSNIKPPCQRGERKALSGKNWCASKEEAEAFLALMQLRQLRRAWIGDWEPDNHVEFSIIVYNIYYHNVTVGTGNWSFNYPLTFPTKEMAQNFLSCFRDLCKTAKILL